MVVSFVVCPRFAACQMRLTFLQADALRVITPTLVIVFVVVVSGRVFVMVKIPNVEKCKHHRKVKAYEKPMSVRSFFFFFF